MRSNFAVFLFFFSFNVRVCVRSAYLASLLPWFAAVVQYAQTLERATRQSAFHPSINSIIRVYHRICICIYAFNKMTTYLLRTYAHTCAHSDKHFYNNYRRLQDKALYTFNFIGIQSYF